MVKSVLWTASRARLQLVLRDKNSWINFQRESAGNYLKNFCHEAPVLKSEKENLNWVFLPGGPGLGSESLLPLLDILKLPGSLWLLDLPGDGSNTTSDNLASFSKWPLALIEAVSQFDRVILVAHSTGGMYALSLPDLEGLLEGLILLDSAPNARWQDAFAEIVRHSPVPGLELLQERYEKKPNNQTLKEITLASAPYLFTQRGQASGIESLRSLPYNYETCQWSEKNFDRTYQAKWIPETIPTLILAGEKDLVTPLRLFKDEKRFDRENIILKSIKGAGHFPWIENPMEVAIAFSVYANQFK
jgi:pimeloyl-ACP methyl ester carboxylesterase